MQDDKAKYKEMFEYSYTIVIFIFVLIGMIIYYTYFLLHYIH